MTQAERIATDRAEHHDIVVRWFQDSSMTYYCGMPADPWIRASSTPAVAWVYPLSERTLRMDQGKPQRQVRLAYSY